MSKLHKFLDPANEDNFVQSWIVQEVVWQQKMLSNTENVKMQPVKCTQLTAMPTVQLVDTGDIINEQKSNWGKFWALCRLEFCCKFADCRKIFLPCLFLYPTTPMTLRKLIANFIIKPRAYTEKSIQQNQHLVCQLMQKNVLQISCRTSQRFITIVAWAKFHISTSMLKCCIEYTSYYYHYSLTILSKIAHNAMDGGMQQKLT